MAYAPVVAAIATWFLLGWLCHLVTQLVLVLLSPHHQEIPYYHPLVPRVGELAHLTQGVASLASERPAGALALTFPPVEAFVGCTQRSHIHF